MISANLPIRWIQLAHSLFLKVSRRARPFPKPVLVIGSPWIGGAGRTSLIRHLIQNCPIPPKEINVLCYDIHSNGIPTDDSQMIAELGVKVYLTRNRFKLLNSHFKELFSNTKVLFFE